MKSVSTMDVMRGIGLLLIGLVVAFLLFMGIGEVAGGDLSGISHLIPAVVLAGMAAAGLKWPRSAGAVLALTGLAIAVFFYAQMSTLQTRLTAIALTGGPVFLGGLLILGGAYAGRSRHEHA